MGLFSFLGDAGKAIGGVALDIAGDVIPGGGTVVGLVESGIGAIRDGDGADPTPVTRVQVPNIGFDIATFGIELTRDIVAQSSGPSANPGTQETQPFTSVLDKIKSDFEGVLRGVAEGFGRDAARGASQELEQTGGVPVTVGGSTSLLTIGVLGVAAALVVLFVTR